MSCSSYQDHILFDYACGRLSADEAEQVRRHLADCTECRRDVAFGTALSDDLKRLEQATRYDLPDAAALGLLVRAARALSVRESETTRTSLAEMRRRAKRRRRTALLRRMLIPVAAVVIVLLGLNLVGPYFKTRTPEAINYLYADARKVIQARTVEGMTTLQPRALGALDEAIASPNPDVRRVANLQLIHYITLRATEPDQVDDIRFLLSMLQADERAAGTGQPGLNTRTALAGLQSTACAASPVGRLDRAAALVRGGEYEKAFNLLAGDDRPDALPLAAYAAIRAGHLGEARESIDALDSLGGRNPWMATLLKAELAMLEERFSDATNYFVTAARSVNRLWFQAGYLCKYELGDEILAGQYFSRADDPRLAGYVAERFRSDVAVARQKVAMIDEDYESYAVGRLPAQWKFIPTHPDEFLIAKVDGSRVLKQNEMGHRGGKLVSGFPAFHDYLMSCDFKVIRSEVDPQLDFLVYDRGKSHYALELSGSTARLQHKARRAGRAVIARPENAQVRLPSSIRDGQWWNMTVRVRNISETETEVTATVRLRSQDPTEARTFTWIDRGGEGAPPLRKGRVGFRVGGAEVAFDNLVVHADE